MAKRIVACLTAAFFIILCSAVLAQRPSTPAPSRNTQITPTRPSASQPPARSATTRSAVRAEKALNPDEVVLREPPIPGSETIEPLNFNPAYNWTMYKGNPGHTGYTDEQLNFPLKLSWKFLAQISNDNPSSPAVADGVVYFCAGRRLFAVNSETGSLRWFYPKFSALTSVIKSSPLVGSNFVYFGGGDGRLYAIKKSNGELAWAFLTKGTMSSSPVLVDGVIYVGSSDNNLYAIDAETGELRWSSGFRTKASITASPAVYGDSVYFISNDMMLYAAHTLTGRIKWTSRLGIGSSTYAPVASENAIYVVSANILQSFNSQSGRVNWSVRFPTNVISSPAIADGKIYVTCKDRKLYCVTTGGRLKWKLPVDLHANSYGGPIVSGDTVIVNANNGILIAADSETGMIKWEFVVQPSTTMIGTLQYVNLASPAVVSNGTLYVLADDGALYAFRNDAPDEDEPIVEKFVPARNTLMFGTPPIELAAIVKDIGSGINPDTITLSLNNVPVKHNYIMDQGLIWYKTPVTSPAVNLPDGKHSISLSVEDWAGNTSLTQWSIYVDNRGRMLPVIIPTPGVGAPDAVSPTGPAGPAVPIPMGTGDDDKDK